MDWKKRVRNKNFWIAVAAFVALTGQVWGMYEVPQGWDTWVNMLLSVLTLGGIIINPTTDGFKD
jgi:uncharacterized membrane protein